MADNRPIGVFDSGVGGLTVVKQILRLLPNESVVYLGDCARAPYGDRDNQTLAEFSRQIVDFLLTHDIKTLVVACGTISARIFDRVQAMVDIPIVGMVSPAVRGAVNATKNGKIGVIATAGTIDSNAHKAAITALHPTMQVTGVVCPLFVPLVEEGWCKGQIADLTAKAYLEKFDGYDIDTLLLGCTHYPLLIDSIAKALPRNVSIIDPAVDLVQDLQVVLDSNNIRGTSPASPRFFVTGMRDKFDRIAQIALGGSYGSEVVVLE